ncbi:MAG: hypothetical protein AB1698_01640 [Pseudomonadota bacterium]
MKREDWPEVPEDLVAYLEASYPARCKAPGEGLEEHAFYAGQVELIAILRSRVASRSEDDLREPEDMTAEEIEHLRSQN